MTIDARVLPELCRYVPDGVAMIALLEYLINGISMGMVYALIALGYTMVYGILRMINFSHGEVFMVGGFVGWAVISTMLAVGRGASPSSSSPPRFSRRSSLAVRSATRSRE